MDQMEESKLLSSSLFHYTSALPLHWKHITVGTGSTLHWKHITLEAHSCETRHRLCSCQGPVRCKVHASRM